MIVHLMNKMNQLEQPPVKSGQMIIYQMIDLAPEVVFMQLEQGKEAIFVANGQLQQTSIVRSLTKTERGLCFETENAGFVQKYAPRESGA